MTWKSIAKDKLRSAYFCNGNRKHTIFTYRKKPVKKEGSEAGAELSVGSYKKVEFLTICGILVQNQDQEVSGLHVAIIPPNSIHIGSVVEKNEKADI